MAIRDLTDGSRVELVLLVRSVERRARKGGKDFLKVSFADKTGSVPANIWDDVELAEQELPLGQAVRVWGKFEVHDKFGAQLRLERFAPAAEGSYDPSELRSGPPVPVPELERRLRELIASVQAPDMAAMLEAVLGESTETWALYRIAPAAKRVHQAYRHGLLEHCLTVAEAVAGAAAIFPGIDRDLSVAAALVHDIGKLDAYCFTGEDIVDLTDAGKLRGEIVLGHERLSEVLDGIDGISEARRLSFLHIILAHHGKLEHGSPVTPQTREALLVHMMDNLGGKLGTADRLEQECAPGSAWSGYDRAFGGSVWFADVARAGEDHEANEAALGLEPLPADAPPATVPLAAFEESAAWQPPPVEDFIPPVPEPARAAHTAGEQPGRGEQPPPETQPLPF